MREPRLREPEPSVRLRNALGRFATGVCVVVTTDEDGQRHGCTVNAFTSVSLDPPLLLVAVACKAKAHAALAGRPFTVNVLGAEQTDVALNFAGAPKPEVVRWSADHPTRLVGALAWFDCRDWAVYEGGDHSLFVGEVERFACQAGDALGYYEGRFVQIEEASLGLEYVL